MKLSLILLLATVVCVHSTFLGARRLRSSPTNTAVQENPEERKERVRAQHVARFFGNDYSSNVPRSENQEQNSWLRLSLDSDKSPGAGYFPVPEGNALTPNQLRLDKVFPAIKEQPSNLGDIPPIYDGPVPSSEPTTSSPLNVSETSEAPKPSFRFAPHPAPHTLEPEPAVLLAPSPALVMSRPEPRPPLASPPGLLVPRPDPVPLIPKEKMTLDTEDYALFDNFHNRGLSFFDPEYYVMAYPYYVFPYELDIPFGWAIYNPVTVQAPKPIPERTMRNVRFSGYYYACPKWANPFDYSWFTNKEEQNPCRWIWYQTRQDQLLRS